MQFRLLGPFEVEMDGAAVSLGGRQRRTLLAILAVHAGEIVSTGRIIDELWGEAPPSAARKSVQAHIAHLRRNLNITSEVLAAADAGYVLQVEPGAIDSHRFETLLGEAKDLRQTAPLEAAKTLGEALDLFHGTPLAGLADDAFSLRLEASRLEELRLGAIEDRLDAFLEAGEDASVAVEANRLVIEHPLRERLWGTLMLALYRSGRQADALRAYSRARQALAEELGIEPSTQLQELEQKILDQDPSLSERQSRIRRVETPVRHVVRNPYKGLRAFEEADSSDFFGRDDLVRQLQDRLDSRSTGQLTVLAGPSGAGKSSVVRAGLIPRLRVRDENVAVMFPGHDPIAALTTAIAEATDQSPGDVLASFETGASIRSPVVVVVDQFEELFTIVGEKTVVDRFLEMLADRSQPIRWVITVRADFLDRLLAHPRLGSLLNESLILVPPLQEHEVREAVVGPLVQVGIQAEPELVAAVVNDVQARAGALPLLQYALTDTFERSKKDVLSVADYQRAGGISGALARRAENLFTILNPEQQTVVRQLFLDLVTVTDEGEEARRRVAREALLGLGEATVMRTIIDRFGTLRFLTFDQDPESGEPTVEIAHEALITEWPRLTLWIDEARDDLRTRRRLALAVSEWEESGRDSSFLLSGARLAEMEVWATTAAVDVPGHARELLGRSRQAEDVARRRKLARRRVLTAVLGIAVVVSAGLAIAAIRSADAAREQTALSEQQTLLAEQAAARAEEQARISRVRQLAAASVANLEVDPELSSLLALEAVAMSGDHVLPEAEEALHRAVLADRLLGAVPNGGNGLAHISPDGATFISQGVDPSTVQIWTVDPIRPVMTLAGHEDEVIDAVYSRQGDRIASASVDGTIRIWDPSAGEVAKTLRVPGPAPPFIPVFSWDGEFLAATTPEGTVFVWNLENEEIVWRLGPPPGTYFALNLDFSPDGSLLAVAPENDDFTAHVWDLSTGELVQVLAGHDWWVKDVGFTPDGSKLVTGSFDTTLRVWNTETWETELTHFGHESSVWDLQVSPDGRVVASSGNNEAVVWALDTGETLTRFVAHDGIVDGVDISPDGKRLLTGSQVDRSTRLWDVTPTAMRELLTLPGTKQTFGGVSFSPDGQSLAASSDDGKVTLWDAAAGNEIGGFQAPGPVESISFHPDGGHIAIGGFWGAGVYDVDSKTLQILLDGIFTTKVGFSGSGLLGAASEDGLIVWSDWTGEDQVLRTDRFAFSFGFDPAGEVVVVSVNDGPFSFLEVIDLAHGEVLATHHENGDRVMGIEFSSDGSWFATASQLAHADFWAGDSYEHLRRIEPSTGQILSLSVHPNGSEIATGGDDETLRIIDAETGTVLLTLPGMPFADVQYSPDGRYLVATGPSGPVMVYIREVEELVAHAESRLTRWWTEFECLQYLQMEECPARPEGFEGFASQG